MIGEAKKDEFGPFSIQSASSDAKCFLILPCQSLKEGGIFLTYKE
jgi:hypothetical protein